MHTFTRGVVGLALLAAAATGLAACSTDGAPPRAATTSTPTPMSDPTSSPTEVAAERSTTVDFGPAPEQATAPPCSTLLPSDLVDVIVPGATGTDLLTDAAHVNGTWSSIRVDGGTECWATNGVSPLDVVTPTEQGDPVFEGISVSVLPRAAAALDAATTAASQLQDAPLEPTCDASDAARVYCRGDVLAQNAWVSVAVTRLQDDADATPEAIEPAYRTLLERVRAAVAASPAGTQTGPDSPDASFTPCSPDRVNAVTTVTLRDPYHRTDTVPWLAQAATTRAGGEHCVFGSGSGWESVDAAWSTTPRAGWFVEQRLGAGLVDRADRVDLPGLGDGDGAWRTCDDTACSIDVVHDGTWTQYFLQRRVAPNTSEAVLRWAESSFRV
ncbi:hypothetical protein LQK89_15500 [Curtobacterium sp. C1]|uniref:hypothetical protein n=1 Tax=Curtobacterium sp. C1 TaxID=2898151 RepID=UPI001E430FC8|nr:hypothetical protein [Curtobacterium sp. C1]UFU13888.1 hypothetical protein LQK89_15500 [Curtobacterium sp. C1]